MKRRLCWLLLLLTLGGAVVAGLYESATHVGRGWLNGEAFFEGRPTSYWRGRLDEWLDRFDSPENAERDLGAHFGFLDGDTIAIRMPAPRTWWNRPRAWFQTAEDRRREDLPPQVL